MAAGSPQSALRFPLNEILGADSHVRTLRALFTHGEPAAASMLAETTGLAVNSVRKALEAFEIAALAEPIGAGRAVLFRLRREHPLYGSLAALFESESMRFNRILEEASAAACATPDAVALWIYGSVARKTDKPTSDIDFALAIDGGDAAAAEADFLNALAPAAQSLAFTPSIVALERADILRLANENDPWWSDLVRDASPLRGDAPAEHLEALRRTARTRAK